MGCVYMVTHKGSGRIYIGQTVNTAAHRWSTHVYEAKRTSNCKVEQRAHEKGETMSPLDSKGVMRHNHEAAAMHSEGNYSPNKAAMHEGDGGHTEVHNHGDGTFHTVHDGQQEEHESIGHMHAHLSKIHGEDGHSHFHAHHDGVAHHSHGVHSGGEPEHREHDNEEGVHDHLTETMGEGKPIDDEGEEEVPAGKGLGSLY